jgi:hypothetical protein
MKFWTDIIDHAQIRRPLAGASTLYGAPMDSTLTPKANDDPHDVVVVAPDAVRVAPSRDEISELLRGAARHRADAQVRAAPDSSAGPTVPPVDTTFRPAALDVTGPSMMQRLARGFVALLLAACIGGGALVWKAYGDAATKQIAKLATQVVMMVSEKPAVAAQPAAPAVQADATNTASPQTAASAPTAADAAAPFADPAPSLQSTARDLASLGQQVEQLKASIEQLRASQQQMSRDLAKASEMKTSEVRASEAKVSEQNLRPKIPAPPPRRVAARTPRPLQPYSPPPLAAPAPPPAAAPYVPQATYVAPAAAPYMPRQPDYAVRSPEPPPLTTGQSLTDPELSSVPRPPMPLR